MTRAVVLVPFRGDGGRRDELWGFVEAWLRKHHPDWPIVIGLSPEGPFNKGAAINNAASVARILYEPDVYVVHDADNIADPGMLVLAVLRALEIGGCVFPFSCYTYLDEFSTDRLMREDNWFVSPEGRGFGVPQPLVIRDHTSGVQAVSRAAFEAIGGFLELSGWGFEDNGSAVLLETFTRVEHLQGGAYHLFHEFDRAANKLSGDVNRRIVADILALSVVPDQLKAYLRSGGHEIP